MANLSPRAQTGRTVAPPAAPAAHTERTAKYAVVGSKLRVHLELQLCKETTAAVTGQFGSVTEKVMVKHGARYLIRGTGHPEGTPPKGFPKAPEVNADGYAITRGIPFDFMREWMRQNEMTDMVQNKMIVMEADEDELASQTSDFTKLRSGLDPINPDGDARSPKPLNAAIQDISKAEID